MGRARNKLWFGLTTTAYDRAHLANVETATEQLSVARNTAADQPARYPYLRLSLPPQHPTQQPAPSEACKDWHSGTGEIRRVRVEDG